MLAAVIVINGFRKWYLNMARVEQEREDLFGEATAYPLRGELGRPGEQNIIFVGLKPAGEISCYFGADPVYHLDAAGHLRRAYVNGQLYRTQGSTLARLVRQRTETESTLLREDLTELETERFLQEMQALVTTLCHDLQGADLQVLQATTDKDSFRRSVRERLTQILAQPAALAPRIRGKR